MDSLKLFSFVEIWKSIEMWRRRSERRRVATGGSSHDEPLMGAKLLEKTNSDVDARRTIQNDALSSRSG
jgi:hypothetical protein